VLVIDDGADNRVLLKAFLERAGYRALLAEHGEAGLALIDREAPDLVLLDYMMPEMDGAEVARRIRQRPALRDLPIIILTASAHDEGAIERAFAAGANDYMTKPFDRRIMLARIGSTIRAAEDRTAARLGQRAQEQRDALLVDLEEASRVQRAQATALPAHFALGSAMGAIVPASHVGGDLLQIFSTDTTCTAVVIDVSGHGTAAALVAASVVAELRNQLATSSLGEAMAQLNLQLGAPGSHHYACVAAMQIEAGQATVINAGLPPVALVRAGKVITLVEASGSPPGLIPDAEYLATTLRLERGDRLIAVSDGLTESLGHADDLVPCLFGLRLLDSAAGLPAEELTARIRKLFSRRHQEDDATVLVLDYDPVKEDAT
jgi:sigma-B regulation protein RsbU (phosphoserine phosphatase)